MTETDTFEWTSPQTWEVVNVLTATEERFNQALWHIDMWLYPEEYLRDIIREVPLAEPIDLDAVDWDQVALVVEEAALTPSPHEEAS